MDPFQDGRNVKVAVVLYYDAWSGHLPAPISNRTIYKSNQFPRVIRPFQKWAILCESASLRHKALMAGQRSPWGIRRWSRRSPRDCFTLVNLFLAGKDQQQTSQPYDQAGA